jgi:zinc protease
VKPARVCRSVVVVVALIAVAGCGGRISKPPRFGSLQADRRDIQLEHGIELMQARNGLVVALLPDPRTNLVTVDVRYTVGAAEDPDGRAGMAHLVEHLMFEATPQPGGPTISDQLSELALFHNAWTNADETHYTSRGLATQLDALLAVEAARMQVTCDQVDDARFLRERDVVLAETALRGDAALAHEVIAAVWGETHPYAHPIGSAEIAEATRAEACAFIDAHYAPNRAILVITGNFELDAASRAIAAAFGSIARKSTASRAAITVPRLAGTTTDHVADVDEATALVMFRAPGWGRDAAVHALVAYSFGDELDELDDATAWITDTAVGTLGGVRSRVLYAAVSVDDPARLDDAVAAVRARAEVVAGAQRWQALDSLRGAARTAYAARYDDFESRGGWIADYLQYTDHRWFFLLDLTEITQATESDVAAHAARTFDDRYLHVARITPSGKAATRTRISVAADRDHDLAPWRAPADAADAMRAIEAPAARAKARIQDYRLDNGLRVVLAPDALSPIVDARLVFPAGTGDDPADRPGVALAAASILDHDYERKLTPREHALVTWALQLGTLTSETVDDRATVFRVRGLGTWADWHVWRLFWRVDAGVYDDKALARVRKAATAAAADQRDAARDILHAKIYGTDHPLTAARGGVAGLTNIRGGELERFRSAHYRPRGATLVIAGGFNPATIKRVVAELFGAWSDRARDDAAALPPPSPAPGPSYVSVADEDRTQIHATVAFAPRSSPSADQAARRVLTEMVGDRMRIVREGLGASYGVSVRYARGALSVAGPLDPMRAGKALGAMLAELARVRDGSGDLAEDFVRARRRALAAVLATSSGATAIADELAGNAAAGLELDHLARLATAVAALTIDDVTALAARDVEEARMVVLLTGPVEAVGAAFAAAGIPEASIERY